MFYQYEEANFVRTYLNFLFAFCYNRAKFSLKATKSLLFFLKSLFSLVKKYVNLDIQARNRSQIFGGARFGNGCYSSMKKGATIAGADVPEKLIYFWPSKLAKNVSIF